MKAEVFIHQFPSLTFDGHSWDINSLEFHIWLHMPCTQTHFSGQRNTSVRKMKKLSSHVGSICRQLQWKAKGILVGHHRCPLYISIQHTPNWSQGLNFQACSSPRVSCFSKWSHYQFIVQARDLNNLSATLNPSLSCSIHVTSATKSCQFYLLKFSQNLPSVHSTANT